MTNIRIVTGKHIYIRIWVTTASSSAVWAPNTQWVF
ncbi:hypothetical protein AWRI1631_141340 [Saccharomyces cerevisiae AWRI1631]|uniref:Uncharacterized protein n=1 Tax=Saccharomyces cerevisiae (strain AWRI1631) TaxID=545124 RepID=B5VQL3_YEAS6|nr:hypothetical protein AWRI1631_141340 [Saccharomyces cerevisiae AWRI1631]